MVEGVRILDECSNIIYGIILVWRKDRQGSRCIKTMIAQFKIADDPSVMTFQTRGEKDSEKVVSQAPSQHKLHNYGTAPWPHDSEGLGANLNTASPRARRRHTDSAAGPGPDWQTGILAGHTREVACIE